MDVKKVGTDRIPENRVAGNTSASKSNSSGSIASKDVGASGRANKASSTERVNISADASVLAEGLEAAKAAPDARAERVASLKAQIQGGTYKVDAKAVAERMLKSDVEENLLARKG